MESGKLAFVIDNDPLYRDEISTHLQQLGFEVKTFANGSSMMDELSVKPSLIILNYDLGETTTGLEYLQKIQKVAPTIPILFLSPKSDIRSAVQALRFGAFFYVEKNTAFSQKLDIALDHLDLDKRRKVWALLRSLRKGILDLYGSN